MMNGYKRWVQVFDFSLSSAPTEAPVASLEDVANVLLSAAGTEKGVYAFDSERRQLRLAEAQLAPDRSALVMLVRFGDLDGADPSFMEVGTGTARTVEKKEGEANASAAHIVLDLSKNEEPISPLFLLEQVKGIGQSRLVPFINYILKKNCQFTWRDEGGKERKGRPYVQLKGHMSESLRESLKTGELSSVTLENEIKNKSETDEDQFITKEVRTLQISVLPGTKGEKAFSLLRRTEKKIKNGEYSEMRVQYKYGNEKKLQTVRIDTSKKDIIDSWMTKVELIEGFDEPLVDCHKNIRDDVTKKMVSVLKKIKSS